jgi:hypothetical protein
MPEFDLPHHTAVEIAAGDMFEPDIKIFPDHITSPDLQSGRRFGAGIHALENSWWRLETRRKGRKFYGKCFYPIPIIGLSKSKKRQIGSNKII